MAFWKQITLTVSQKVLLGIASLLWCAAALWMWIAVPNLTKLPSDFSYSADVISLDNFYDEEKQAFPGQTISVTKFFYQTTSAKNGVLTVKNVFDVRQSTGEKIFAVERLYGIGQETGIHVAGYGDSDRTGYLFAPHGLKEGQPFTYWHINYDEPATMEYQGTENLFGLTVYRYQANYHADQTANLGFLPGVPLLRGVNLDIKLTTWIEPVTGRLIKYEDYTTAYYYDKKTGERLHPWNQFHNEYTEDSVRTQVNLARIEKLKVDILGRVIPMALVVLGLGLMIAAYRVSKKKNKKDAGNELSISPLLLALVVFVCAVGVTVLLWWFVLQGVRQKDSERFSQDVQKISEIITSQLGTYRNAFGGISGLFAASGTITRSEWESYTGAFNLAQNYPGVRGISFVAHVVPENKVSHIRSVRAEGFPDYNIFPAGDRTEYDPVTYIEPFDEYNQRAFGFDIFSDLVRRTAIERARDSGKPTLTGKITLIQEKDPQAPPGFLLIVPVYKKVAPHETTTDRRNAIIGYVTAPFRVDQLIDNLKSRFNPNVAFAIYDGSALQHGGEKNAALMYTSDQSSFTLNPSYSPVIKRTVTVAAIDYPWVVSFVSTPSFGSDNFQHTLLFGILGLGTLASVFLAFLVYSLTTERVRALSYAEATTKDLRAETENLLKEKVKSDTSAAGLAARTTELEAVNKLMVDRELKMIELKKQNESLQRQLQSKVA